MTADFLSRLADLALGQGAIVRPHLTPLFAAPAAASASALDDRGASFGPVFETSGARETAGPGRPREQTGADRDAPWRVDSPDRPLVERAIRPIAASGLGLALPSPGSPFDFTAPVPPAAAVNAERSSTPPVRSGSGWDGESPAPMPTPLMPARAETGRVHGASDDPAQQRPPVAAAEPVVKVTIGRIDVRALQPAPPQPIRSAAAPAPHLTLDDYLRQRREGRR